MIRNSIVQAIGILTLSTVLGLGVNILRQDGIPLVHAEKCVVQLDAANGEIALKDAAMLFLSKRAVFLDARSRMEFESGHIQGALEVPVEDFDDIIEEIVSRLKEAEVIITYCDGEQCHLSHDLAQLVKEQGFSNVYVLKNGWTLWRNERLPVEQGVVGSLFPEPEQALCTVCGS